MLAADLLGARPSSHLLLVLPLVASQRTRVGVAVPELLQDLVLVRLAVAVGLHRLAVQDLRDLFDVGGSDRSFLGISDQELDVEVAVGHWVFVERQAQSFGGLEFLMVEDFSRRSSDDVLLAVQVLDLDGDSGQCLKQSNLLDDDQVRSSSLEGLVLLDLDTHVDVARDDARLNRWIRTYSSFSPVKM